MPDANALDPSPLMRAPVAQWLALQRAKNTAEGIGDDNLLNRVFSRGDPYYAPPPTPAAARPIWSPDNPVGTSVLHDTYAGPASSSFSPLVTRPYADVPITAAKAAEIETGARDYSLNLFGNLALAEVPDIGRLPGEPVALPSKRVRAPGADRPPEPGTRAVARKARSASLDGHLPFPDAEDPAAQEGPTAPAAALPAQAPSDDLTTLYHGTSPEGAAQIKADGQVKGPAFLSPNKATASGYAAGGPVVELKVPKSDLKVDFDLPNGQLLNIADANSYSGRDGWGIDDYLRAGHNVGVDKPISAADAVIHTPSAEPPATPTPAAAGPVSHSLDGHVPFPDAAPLAPRPAGAPVMESLAGRLGSNADADLAALGMPAYGDIVPSRNTGPVTPAQLQAGSPAHPDHVLDLSNTWQVPDVPQTDLARIDPYGGKRKGLPEHIINAMSNPDLEAKLRFVAEKGLEVGGAHWYNAEPLRQAFIDRLGPEEGNAQFNRYIPIVGATSAGSEVGQNVRAASYYHVMERAGTPVRTSNDLIPPYGHKMQQAHVSGYRGLDEGDTGTLNPETQPKRSSFVANLGGNQQPVTGDKHFIRLIGMLSQDPAFLNGKTVTDVNYPALGIAKGESRNWKEEVQSGRITMEQALQHPHMWQDMPDPNHYGALEAWAQHIAGKMGLTPAQFQAALWVGGGRVTGLRSLPTSFLGIVENRLHNTAVKRGITKEQALDDFIRGRHPLLTPLGAVGAAGAAAAAGAGQDQQ